MSNEDGRKVELCGLWEHESKSGSKYWSGSLGNAKVLVFRNTNKKNPKSPDMNIYLVPSEKTGTPFVRKGPSEEFGPKDFAPRPVDDSYEGFAGKNDDLGF